MNKFNLFLISILFITGCNEKSREGNIDDTNTIIINPLISKDNFQDPKEVIDSTWTIKLEANNDNLISYCNRLIAFKDYFVIFDMKQQKVFIFDKSGKYLTKIDSRGKGPNEYLHIEDIYINKDSEIVLFDAPNKCLLFYSTIGNFIKKEKLSHNIDGCFNIRKFNKGYIYFTGYKTNSNTDVLNHNLTIENDKGELTNFFDIREQVKIKILSPDNYLFQNSNNEIFFQEPFRNSIYKINEFGLEKEFILELGKKALPENSFFCINSEKFRKNFYMNNRYLLMPGSVQVTLHHFIVPIFNGERIMGNIFISRESGKSFFIKTTEVPIYARCSEGDTIVCISDYFNTLTKEKTTLNDSENPTIYFYSLKQF